MTKQWYFTIFLDLLGKLYVRVLSVKVFLVKQTTARTLLDGTLRETLFPTLWPTLTLALLRQDTNHTHDN